MKNHAKPIETLQIVDLQAYPIWQYSENEKTGDTVVHPVKQVPVKNLKGKIIATQIRLANGTLIWALIGNVEVGTPRLTEHFLTLSVTKSCQWFTLSRYHDFDYGENGPEALASFLCLRREEVFPIAYDISQFVNGDPAGLSGNIPIEPREKLTRSEIIGLAVP